MAPAGEVLKLVSLDIETAVNRIEEAGRLIAEQGIRPEHLDDAHDLAAAHDAVATALDKIQELRRPRPVATSPS